MAHLTFHVSDLGLHAHQMAGFDDALTCTALGMPDDCELMTVIAIGYLGKANDLRDDLRDAKVAPQTKRPTAPFVFGAAGAKRWSHSSRSRSLSGERRSLCGRTVPASIGQWRHLFARLALWAAYLAHPVLQRSESNDHWPHRACCASPNLRRAVGTHCAWIAGD